MFSAIDAFQDKELGVGADVTSIANASRSLGVRLPDSYRAFLLKCGWARFAHEEICGLGPTVPAYLDLTATAKLERESAYHGMPNHLVPLMNDGAGNQYCIDSSADEGGESPIVFWDHESGRATERVAPSFATWLIGRLNRLRSIPKDASWMDLRDG